MRKPPVIVSLVLLTLLLSTPTMPVQAAAAVDACDLWRVAGAQLVYKCEDDYNGVVCYVPVAGVMQCLAP